MKKAFSLIELLISLIVISLIIASFTPVLSKKLKHREVAYSKIKQMKIDCSPFNTSQGQCLLCDERQCNLCTSSINVPDGYYVNPNLSCNRKPCSDFNSNCKRCTKDGCQECKSGYILNSSGSCTQVKCGKGHKVSGTSCTKCEANTIQPNDNYTGTSCSACSNDEISNDERTSCSSKTCNAGEYRSGRNCYNCPFGTYQTSTNHTNTSCSLCSSANANCSNCNALTGCCTSCTNEYSLSGCSCSKNITCTSPCATCSETSTNCTSCIDGGYKLINGKCKTLQAPSSQADCGSYTYYYNGACYTTRNAGDVNGPNTNVSGVTTLSVSQKCETPGSFNCCWKAVSGINTAKAGCTTTGYNACNRTVCQYEAAKAICENYSPDWAPKWELVDKISLPIIGKSIDLCAKSVSGYSTCETIQGKDYCYGARGDADNDNTNKCAPPGVWTSDFKSGQGAVRYSPGLSNDRTTRKMAYSVRCMTKQVYK